MLNITYRDNTYTFYVSVSDSEPQPKDGLDLYLFKFTNDMSDDVKWGYGQNQVVYDRYAKFDMFNSTSKDEDVLGGKINFDPQGYWKYEIYWISGTLTPCGSPNPTEKGTWKCLNAAAAVIDSGNLDVENYEITNLSADTYTIHDYDTCSPSTPNNSATQVISAKDCTTDPERFLRFTKVDRFEETSRFHITSNAVIGSEIKLVGLLSTYTYVVQTLPEDITISVKNDRTYTPKLYTSVGVLIDTYNIISAYANPAAFDSYAIMASNNEYSSTSCSHGDKMGNIIFAFKSAQNTRNLWLSTTPIEVGKLLVQEQVGEEQVQYQQHPEPSGTNYIYNE
tara:strand:+ start:1129 stop:2139 length:1011 start_codon:yes stop_codon:yes gene_type:complete